MLGISSLRDLKKKTSRIFSRRKIYVVNSTASSSSYKSSLDSEADNRSDHRYGIKQEKMVPAETALPIIETMMSMSKLETFKNNHVSPKIRLKERLLRHDVYMDSNLTTHIKGQIHQMGLANNAKCRFPNMQDICLLVVQDLIDYGNEAKARGGLVGETKNSRLVSKAFLPVYGFDDKSVTFWFRHQKVFRKVVNDEVEELLMVNRYIKLNNDWIDYHDKFWSLSEQAMSSLNVLAFLIYSLNIPVKPLLYSPPQQPPPPIPQAQDQPDQPQQPCCSEEVLDNLEAELEAVSYDSREEVIHNVTEASIEATFNADED